MGVDLSDPKWDVQEEFDAWKWEQAQEMDSLKHRLKILETAFLNADYLQEVLKALPTIKRRYETQERNDHV